MKTGVCIVIPCFNEAARFKSDEFLHFVKDVADVDLCFVNDGSTDHTLEKLTLLQSREAERIKVVTYPDNRGKAEAVRVGFLQMAALGEYGRLAFADADLATPLSEMLRLINIARRQEDVVLVMGSRLERMGVTIRRKFYRHFTGRIFAGTISFLFRLKAYDTQCGAKVFRADTVPAVFEEPFLSHWLFDVEILLRLRNLRSDYDRIVQEIPLNVWLEQGNSKIRFSHLLKMPYQLFRIFLHY